MVRPVFFICQYGAKLCSHFVPKSQIHQFWEYSVQKLAVQGRYNIGVFSSVLTGCLQGLAERPLPCNYIVFQLVCALSRR